MNKINKATMGSKTGGRLVPMLVLILVASVAIGAGYPGVDTVIGSPSPGTTSSTTATVNPYSAVFGMTDQGIHHIGSMPTQIANYTFYIPVDSNVYVEGSGVLSFLLYGPVYVEMGVSNINPGYSYVFKPYTCYGQNGCADGIDFHTSRVYALNKGYHTVTLYAFTPNNGQSQRATQIYISVIANQVGGLQVKY